MLDLLADYLDLRSTGYGRLDGQMQFSERQQQMSIFQRDPDCRVFLTSTRAGGLGINLTAADTVIIYDSDWVCWMCVCVCVYFLLFQRKSLLVVGE